MSTSDLRVINLTGVKQTFYHKGAAVRLPVRGLSGPICSDLALRLQRQGIVEIPAGQLTVDSCEWLAEDGMPQIHWQSPFSMGDGYATAAEHTLHAAIAAGVHAQADHLWFLVEDGLEPETLELLRAKTQANNLVGICMATPGEFKKIAAPYKIGWTMFETTDPLITHPEWRHECNAVDRLWVPCDWCRDVFSSFVHRPIDVVPLAINPAYCNPVKRQAKDTFTVICFATLTGRKSPHETLDVFERAFPIDKYPDARMIFKTRLGFFGFDLGQMPDLADPRVSIESDDWYAERMKQFMYEADCMLYLPKGEGYGLTPREAMATGLPTIVADHTGMKPMCNSIYNYPIPTHHTEVSKELGGDWYIPNFDYAVDVLRWMYENRKAAYETAFKGAKWLIDTQGPEAVGAQVLTALQRLGPVSESKANKLMRDNREATRAAFEVHELRHRYHFGYDEIAKLLVDDIDFIHVTNDQVGVVRDIQQRVGNSIKVSPIAHVSATTATVSVGQFHQMGDSDIRKLLRSMLMRSKQVFILVPTVHRGEDAFESERLMRKEQWAYILQGFNITNMVYDKREAYLLIAASSDGITRGTLIRNTGRQREGVWRPR